MRLGRVLRLCLATGAFGCAAETTDLASTPTVETAEHRLVAWGYDHDDGAAVATHIHDVELDTRCRPGLAEDGTYRCFPIASYGYSPGLYVDATCETPAIGVSGGAPWLRYAMDVPSDCDEREATVAYELAEVPVDVAYAIVNGRCEQIDRSLPLRGPPYFEVRRLESDHFVAMTRELEPIGDGLSRVTFATAAGARFTVQIEDTTNRQVCTPMPFDGDLRCGPSWYGFGLYGDETCGAIEGLMIQGTTCVEPTYAVALTQVGHCASTTPVRVNARAAVIEEQYLRNGSDQCVLAIPGGGSSTTFEVTEVQPSAVFAPLQLRPSAGERVRARHYTSSNGAELGRLFRVLFDETVQTECRPRKVAGTLRCVPVDSYRAFDAYLDEACSQPIRTISAPNGRPAPVLAYDAPDGLGTPFGPIDRLYEVGTPVDVEALFYLNGDVCVAGAYDEWNSCRTQYLVGAEIDPSRYAPLNEGIIR